MIIVKKQTSGTEAIWFTAPKIPNSDYISISASDLRKLKNHELCWSNGSLKTNTDTQDITRFEKLRTYNENLKRIEVIDKRLDETSRITLDWLEGDITLTQYSMTKAERSNLKREKATLENENGRLRMIYNF